MFLSNIQLDRMRKPLPRCIFQIYNYVIMLPSKFILFVVSFLYNFLLSCSKKIFKNYNIYPFSCSEFFFIIGV